MTLQRTSHSKPAPRTIVVTGGGSGIGLAVAFRCAKRGDRVAILDKNGEAAEGVARQLGKKRTLGLCCDVGNEDQVEWAFSAIDERFGPPYGLFANAGIEMGGHTHELPLDTWHRVIETNLTGVFLCCKHALQRMIAAQQPASIVCTSSPAAFAAIGQGHLGAYSATKAGVSALVRCMAVEYAPYRIRVNTIVPGATDTALMWSNVALGDVESVRAQVEGEIPLARIADADEPAGAAAWLLSDDSSYVTGSDLVCDGGILAKSSISA